MWLYDFATSGDGDFATSYVTHSDFVDFLLSSMNLWLYDFADFMGLWWTLGTMTSSVTLVTFGDFLGDFPHLGDFGRILRDFRTL
jgi:hypothetical protein